MDENSEDRIGFIDFDFEFDAEISKEIRRLNKIYKDLDPDKKKLVAGLIENAAFLRVTLMNLSEIIKKKGYTEPYQNGASQFGTKNASEMNMYNVSLKNYTAIISKLDSFLPKLGRKPASPLMEFIEK